MLSQRFSYQREQIYQAVCSSCSHPTAETVYQQLKPGMPRLSLGTVYRNLHQMAREGRLTEMAGPVARFDGNTAPHTHLRCIQCGGVSDLDEMPYDSALDRLAERSGAVVASHTLVFTGFCPVCANNRGDL
jgi:Fe2+ or Zn2+ uptake regulation protein